MDSNTLMQAVHSVWLRHPAPSGLHGFADRRMYNGLALAVRTSEVHYPRAP